MTIPVEKDPAEKQWRTKLASVPKDAEQWMGAASDGLVDGSFLTASVWGERALTLNSGLLAFAYLYRRFGESKWGHDSYKGIAQYVLTTPEPDVLLTIACKGSGLKYGVGYLIQTETYTAHYRMADRSRVAPREWERGPGIMQRVNQALVTAMTDLVQPVNVRDVSITIFGVTS